MAQLKLFNATNEPRTCLWCGIKLRQYMDWRGGTYTEGKVRKKSPCCQAPIVWSDSWDHFVCSECSRGVTEKTQGQRRGAPTGRYGYDGRGFFCRATCGTQFGDALAQHGRRLKPLGR